MKKTLLATIAFGVTRTIVSCSNTSGADEPGGEPFGTGGMGTGFGGAGGVAAGATGAGGIVVGSGGLTGAGGIIASAGGLIGAGGVMASGGATGVGGVIGLGGAGGGVTGSGGITGIGGGDNSDGAAGTGGTTSTVTAPCDIYGSGNTPCVAAHSTVRALYGAYSGNLYQVVRNSDRGTKDIGVLEPGGFADSAAQDSFCAGTTCTISIIYDQSPRGNNLTPAPGGGAVHTADKPVNASKSKLMVGGNNVYAAYFEGGMGYRNNATSGIARDDEPESMYMVTSGRHYNSLCCFDYGNAETDNNDDGNGTMEAIYFGNQRTYWGWGNMTAASDGHFGPWVEADLENGLFAGPVFGEYKPNTALNHDFVTAMVKGKPGGFAIKGGDANAGDLKTMYEGARPSYQGYNPMKKQGAIILGIGGDNSNGSQGTFYEGCMTTGYATDATDAAVQANIIAAGYGH